MTVASTQSKPESWFHSPEFDADCHGRRVQQRAWFQRKAKETVADPDEFQPSVVAARNRYLGPECDKKPRRGDPCQELPGGNDLQVLADTFVANPQHLAQAQEMQRRNLHGKAKRLLLCARIGRRVNCTASEDHKFFQPYLCRCRYCEVCGPAWFREKFSDTLAALEPVVEHLLHEGQGRRRKVVVAKLDFTVPNSGTMPTPEFVREFHADLRLFWRAAERRFGLVRYEVIGYRKDKKGKERPILRRIADYGVAGCDEFGGRKTLEHPLGNTNLHRHDVYVGPRLPQSKARKELSALWSEIRGERSFVSIKPARSFQAALAHALKYPAKFLSASTPERLAELEATFHRTRRFSAGGAFYNVKAVREPGEDSPVGECPLCGARLVEIMEPWSAVFALEAEGRRSVEQVRREVSRAKVFSGAGPP